MKWIHAISDFKDYLKIERGLSENSISSYENDLKKWKILAFDLKVMTVKRMKFKEWEAKKAARDKKIEEDRISGSDESWAKNLIKDYDEIGAEIKEEEVEIPEEFVFD